MKHTSRTQSRGSETSARQLAVTVLREVDESHAYANILLNQQLRGAGLSGPDAGFATELVSGTLRMRGLYDAIIANVAGRDIQEIDVLTRNILRMGTHQLLTLDTSKHAAVNESVELQRKLGKQSATGFVNGVLRRVSQQSLDDWCEFLEAEAPSQDARLALRYSHPEWIIRALRDALDSENASDELVVLLDADNTAPKVNLALLPGTAVDEQRLNALIETHTLDEIGPSPIGFVLPHGSPRTVLDDTLLAKPGALRVQDQGSQLAALALAHAVPIQPNEHWLDLCAGPGGKTALLAGVAATTTASLRAVELAQHRTELVRAAVRANASHVDIVCADGTSEDAFAGIQYDRILVDAPCTGLGALRRRPESRHTKSPSDVAQLSSLQSQLLSAAAAHLAPGGIVAYVTCSPHIAETRVVVDRLLRNNPAMLELDAKSILQEIAREDLKLGGNQLSAQLWPHRNNTDAMFVALLQRRLDS